MIMTSRDRKILEEVLKGQQKLGQQIQAMSKRLSKLEKQSQSQQQLIIQQQKALIQEHSKIARFMQELVAEMPPQNR